MDRRLFVRSGATFGALGMGGLGFPRFASAAWSPRLRADGAIRMNSNENPLGLSPAARQAVIDNLDLANRYPGDLIGQLSDRMCAYYGIASDQLVLGAGSTEILQMIVQAYASPLRKLVLAEPTFEDVNDYRDTYPYDVATVPLTSKYEHDLNRMREESEKDSRPAMVYVCNPNNPTGTITPSAELDNWIADAPEHVLFLMDEAYYEYVDDPAYWSALKWVHDRPNVIVVRTFSKIYGMAGLRLGFGIAHPHAVRRMQDFAIHSSANQLALAAGIACFGDEELMAQSREVNREAREVTEACLDELGLEYLPTHGNFLMHRIGGDLDTYINRMSDAGLLVGRRFPPMLGYNRLSFSLPEHMEQWAETLRDFRGKGWV